MGLLILKESFRITKPGRPVIGRSLYLHSSPDLLATTASTTLVWLILEVGLVYLTLTLMGITTNLSKWDVLAFSRHVS